MMDFAWRKGYEAGLSGKQQVQIVLREIPCTRRHYPSHLPPYDIFPRHPRPRPYPRIPPFRIQGKTKIMKGKK